MKTLKTPLRPEPGKKSVGTTFALDSEKRCVLEVFWPEYVPDVMLAINSFDEAVGLLEEAQRHLPKDRFGFTDTPLCMEINAFLARVGAESSPHGEERPENGH